MEFGLANTNFKNQLKGSNWELVTTPIYSLNTITILAQHIHYYINGINVVFNGGNLDIKDAYGFSFASMSSQAQWDTFLAQFWKDAATFASHIEQMPEEKLQAGFVDEKHGSYQRNIDAMIEHSYYHLGQIVLIKKMVCNA